MLKRDLTEDDAAAAAVDTPKRRVRAKRPNDAWHVDLTAIPTAAGFWVPWLPFARVQRWPFCWWAAVAVDHVSRQLVGFTISKTRPDSVRVSSFLGRVIKTTGSGPRYVITDKGKEFFCWRFKSWCRERGIRPRFGAVGQHGSICIVERFIRSMKSECTRQIIVPFRLSEMRRELSSYASWYNRHRPHSGIGGRTPTEVYFGSPPARDPTDRL